MRCSHWWIPAGNSSIALSSLVELPLLGLLVMPNCQEDIHRHVLAGLLPDGLVISSQSHALCWIQSNAIVACSSQPFAGWTSHKRSKSCTLLDTIKRHSGKGIELVNKAHHRLVFGQNGEVSTNKYCWNIVTHIWHSCSQQKRVILKHKLSEATRGSEPSSITFERTAPTPYSEV